MDSLSVESHADKQRKSNMPAPTIIQHPNAETPPHVIDFFCKKYLRVENNKLQGLPTEVALWATLDHRNASLNMERKAVRAEMSKYENVVISFLSMHGGYDKKLTLDNVGEVDATWFGPAGALRVTDAKPPSSYTKSELRKHMEGWLISGGNSPEQAVLSVDRFMAYITEKVGIKAKKPRKVTRVRSRRKAGPY